MAERAKLRRRSASPALRKAGAAKRWRNKDKTGGNVFVTVGTTRFDALIQAIDSQAFLRVLKSKGFSSLKIQLGKGNYIPQHIGALEEGQASLKDQRKDLERIAVSFYRFKPSIADDMRGADLIISHAGAGSIVEALRLGKSLVVVVNELLMDNHQLELAQAMQERGFLKCTYPSSLETDVEEVELDSFKSFPPPNFKAFPRLLDETMFFIS